jgi:hypothetical protein
MKTTYRYIEGTHTFYKLHLAASPQELVKKARRTARDLIASNYKLFMQQKYSSQGYQVLQDWFSEANREYYRGNIYFNRARLTSDNPRLALLARAATSYTRCQAIIQQVQEALNPPPTSPTDLGLKPFGGEWGEWETKLKEN